MFDVFVMTVSNKQCNAVADVLAMRFYNLGTCIVIVFTIKLVSVVMYKII